MLSNKFFASTNSNWTLLWNWCYFIWIHLLVSMEIVLKRINGNRMTWQLAYHFFWNWLNICRSSHPEVFLENAVLKICSKFTGEHPCRSGISINFRSNLIEIAFRHGCSVNFCIFSEKLFLRTPLGGCFSICVNSLEDTFEGVQF